MDGTSDEAVCEKGNRSNAAVAQKFKTLRFGRAITRGVSGLRTDARERFPSFGGSNPFVLASGG